MTTNIMLTAKEARAKSQNDSIIFNEIRDIEDAILTAVNAGDYEANVTGTTMTATSTSGTPAPIVAARLYFNTWQGTIDDRAKFVQMGKVITYFTDLGYTIDRRTNSLTGDTFKWVVSW
jgi:hypothetical protein